MLTLILYRLFHRFQFFYFQNYKFWNVSIKRNKTNKPLATNINTNPTTNIAPGLPKIYKELEDNPNIYADDKKLMERMKPINYSLMHIPAPKKMILKIRK